MDLLTNIALVVFCGPSSAVLFLKQFSESPDVAVRSKLRECCHYGRVSYYGFGWRRATAREEASQALSETVVDTSSIVSRRFYKHKNGGQCVSERSSIVALASPNKTSGSRVALQKRDERGLGSNENDDVANGSDEDHEDVEGEHGKDAASRSFYVSHSTRSSSLESRQSGGTSEGNKRKKMKKTIEQMNSRPSAVACTDELTGQTLALFSDTKIAGSFLRQKLGLPCVDRYLSRCIRGGSQSSMGFGWRYATKGEEAMRALWKFDTAALMSHCHSPRLQAVMKLARQASSTSKTKKVKKVSFPKRMEQEVSDEEEGEEEGEEKGEEEEEADVVLSGCKRRLSSPSPHSKLAFVNPNPDHSDDEELKPSFRSNTNTAFAGSAGIFGDVGTVNTFDAAAARGASAWNVHTPADISGARVINGIVPTQAAETKLRAPPSVCEKVRKAACIPYAVLSSYYKPRCVIMHGKWCHERIQITILIAFSLCSYLSPLLVYAHS